MMVVIVPGAPYGKGRPKVVKIGGFTRMATPGKTLAYEGLVAHCGRIAMRDRPPFDCALSVVMHVRMPVPASWSGKKQRMALAGEIIPTSKPDVDNVVKACFDGSNGVLWRDDVLVADLVVRKRYAATPCVRMEVDVIDTTDGVLGSIQSDLLPA